MNKDIVAFSQRYDDMSAVAELYLKDRLNPTQIAKRLDMRRVDVLKHIEEFAAIAKNDEVLQERVREALHEADKTVDLVQRENWKLTEDSDIDVKTKATVLKNITDIEFKRQEMIRAAGLMQDAELGDHYAQLEEKQAILEDILKNTVMKCEHCKGEVARKLAQHAKGPQGETIIVVNP